MTKILHLADLHLDSPFRDDPITEAEKRRADLRNVFLNALKYASENGVEIVLISGDLFDGEFYSKATLDFLAESFAETPSCHFIIAPGNHDAYKYASPYKKCNFTANVTVFTTETMQAVNLEHLGVTVYGYAFTDSSHTASPLEGFKVNNGDGFHVLCAHADTESSRSPYAPIKEAELADSGLDYAALGHIHTKPEIQRVGNTLYAYSGCIAGRDFSEYGEKGGILVTLDNAGGVKTVNAERIAFCPWVYDVLNVDLSGAADQKEMLKRIKAVVNDKKNGSDKEYIFKLELVGNVDKKFDASAAAAELKKLGIRKTDDKTTASYNYLGLDTDFTIRGEFYRQLKPLLSSDDPEKRKVAELALTYGLAAMDGNTPVS